MEQNKIVPVTFSARAIDEIRKILASQNLGEEYSLRVAVGGSGCSGGIAPVLGFDKQKDSDVSYLISGVRVVVDKSHFLHLVGKHVEFHEVEDVSGFHFVDTPITPA